jgi:hypothetical protein
MSNAIDFKVTDSAMNKTNNSKSSCQKNHDHRMIRLEAKWCQFCHLN